MPGNSKLSYDVTSLLLEWRSGNPKALERLTPVVYSELRSLAHSYMRSEPEGHMLQTTALVHEAYLRLVGADLEWRGRAHFFSIAARLMRQILVDFAREKQSAKRGSGNNDLPLDEELIAQQATLPDVLMIDQALNELTQIDKRKAKVVELRFFGGLTIEETAEALDISHATVERDLKLSKAWLSRHLGSSPPSLDP